MAMTTNIPPQAYTRDTLVKAIEWMSQQSAAVRERANSADLIVSYYLQARRRMTAAQMEAPVSGEAFKQDLKHLAQDLKQFEEVSAPPPTAPPTPQTPSRSLSHGNEIHFRRPEPPPGTFEIPEAMPLHTHNHLHTAPAPQQHSQQHVHLHVQHAPPPPPIQAPPPPPAMHQVSPRTEAPKGVQWTVDQKSLTFARELQERFNLSNEGEAIRMLITLGIERAREIFP